MVDKLNANKQSMAPSVSGELRGSIGDPLFNQQAQQLSQNGADDQDDKKDETSPLEPVSAVDYRDKDSM